MGAFNWSKISGTLISIRTLTSIPWRSGTMHWQHQLICYHHIYCKIALTSGFWQLLFHPRPGPTLSSGYLDKNNSNGSLHPWGSLGPVPASRGSRRQSFTPCICNCVHWWPTTAFCNPWRTPRAARCPPLSTDAAWHQNQPAEMWVWKQRGGLPRLSADWVQHPSRADKLQAIWKPSLPTKVQKVWQFWGSLTSSRTTSATLPRWLTPSPN